MGNNIKNNLIITLIILLILQLIVLFKPINISRADSYRYEYSASKMNYPGYKDRIEVLKNAHPNWKFVIMETGLDWNDVIDNEYTGHFDTPKNLIQGKSGGWICSICGSKAYDTGEWMCASEQAIRYYMDPRNWLVDSPYLFQFLQTDYMETLDEDIYTALNGTFLYKRDIANIINKVCKEKNASPYFIIARILQEQGTAGGKTYKMQDTDGKYYYNLFNIGATGNTAEEVYYNALERAKEEGWTSIESCLNGGISFILSTYISYKQNTLYLNKFDVETYMGTYIKQYMQNIEAPKNEAISMYNKMKNANLLNKSLTFVIPVYENMPELTCKSPDTVGEISPKNIKVKEGHYGITVRAGRSTTSSQIGRINDSSVIILSVERYADGWHKIVLEDGTVGYIKFDSSYLEETADVTNCYETKIIKDNSTILRAGPGLEHAEVTTLESGESVIRIDNTGRYNFGGNIWDRVILKDGRQGFVIRDAFENLDINEKNELQEGNTATGSENAVGNEENNMGNEITENNSVGENDLQNNENKITENENTNEIENNGEYSNEIENNGDGKENANKVEDNSNATENAISDSQESNEINNNQIEQNNQNNDMNIGENTERNETNNETIEDDTKGEEERKYLVIAPDKNAKDLNGTVTKNGVETSEAGTGYKILIEGREYTIVKRGDVNGDGYVKANDYLIIKDYIIGKNKDLKDEYLQAADVTNDKAVKANDYLKIKDHIMYGVEI